MSRLISSNHITFFVEPLSIHRSENGIEVKINHAKIYYFIIAGELSISDQSIRCVTEENIAI